MSKQRYLDTKFWDDSYIVNKDPIEKFLFIYLLTNPLTNICGIYEISLRRIAFDTGIDKEMVLKILERFEKDDKIKYEDGYVALKNFIKYQKDNPKIRAGISYELKTKPESLVDFVETLDYEPAEREFKRKKIPKSLRDKILKKYNYKCCFCGSKKDPEVDHIIPINQGGTNEEGNLRVLCQSCNGKRNAGLRWDKTKNGWTMGRLSHLNPNTNPNTNPNSKNNDKPLTPPPPFKQIKEEKKDIGTKAEDNMSYRATCYLIDKILANNPRARVPDKDPTDNLMQKWTDEMEKLHRLGPVGAAESEHKGYSWKEIKKIINWCQDDNFWKANILSTPKLREKIVTLENKTGVSKPKISMEESLRKMEEEDGEEKL